MNIENLEGIYQEIILLSEKIASMRYSSKLESKSYDVKLLKIRKKILDLIESTLKFCVNTNRFTLWEKNYLKKALLMFSINLKRENSRAWLQNCVNYIYLATAEPEEKVEKDIEQEIKMLEENDFMLGIEKLREHLKEEKVEAIL